MIKRILSKTKPFSITDTRADFDRACRDAYDVVLAIFKISEDGRQTIHTDKIDFIRSTDSIHVKFLSYEHTGSMGGNEHCYMFEGWIEREAVE